MNIQYGLKAVPTGVVPRSDENSDDKTIIKWSGTWPIPQIGDKVSINFNQLGEAIVESYFIEHGYFGLATKLIDAPEWHRKQHDKNSKHHNTALVFGRELLS